MPTNRMKYGQRLYLGEFMKETLGVHYQTWKNRPAVEYVLENFRKYYPNSPIRMVSDAGDDFSDLADKFSCTFVYEDTNVLPRGILAGHPMSGVTDITPLGGYTWLRRLYDTCKSMDTDWILIMEDDVLTKGIIKEYPTTDAGGFAALPLYSPLTQFLLTRNNRNQTWAYGLCGGGIISRNFFIYAYENNIESFSIKELSKLDDRVVGWTDILLTVFILFCNGSYSVWDGVDQLEYGLTPNAAFQHNVKVMYEVY
jgi:hypothetical protein